MKAHDISKYQNLEGTIILDGKKMTSLSCFYDEIAKSFKFPNYIGRNFNSLSEGLADLSWLPQQNYLILITNGICVLSKENSEILDGFIEILDEIGQEWSEPINVGELWDRPAISFKTIFEVKKHNKKSRISLLHAL